MPAELALIEAIRTRAHKRRSAHTGVRLGIGDDCAIVMPPAGHEVVVTTDFSLEGTHFSRDLHTPHSAGHRTLARGLSDIAAMGARPLAAFLSLAVPRADAAKPRWLMRYIDGLLELAAAFNIPLAGGDTAEAPQNAGILADITVLGAAPAGTALTRSGARAGDALYVTGWLGGAAQELASLREIPDGRNQKAHGSLRWKHIDPVRGQYPQLFPSPRIAQGTALRERNLATACIDVSDGFSTDLTHLCRASNVCAEVDLAALPVAQRLRSAEAAHLRRCLLHGGEDYELLFTTRAEMRVPKKLHGVPITRIGTIVAAMKRQPLITLLGTDGSREALVPGGWEHLR